MQMRKLFFILIGFLTLTFANSSLAQSKKTTSNKKEKTVKKKKKKIKKSSVKGVEFPNEISLKGGINSSSWQFGIKYSRAKTEKKWNEIELEISELKNLKEKKLSIENPSNGLFSGTVRSFVHGKANIILPIHIGFGQKKLIGQKYNENGMGIFFTYQGGLSLAIAKPYYISILRQETIDGTTRQIEEDIKYNGENLDYFLLENDDILGTYGYSGFSKGFNESKLHTGLFFKSSLKFDFSGESRLLKSLEGGISSEFYFNKMPIMALDNLNKKLFVNLFINIEIGQKWK